MTGFRTALIICGILIMAFVTLWSMLQQRRGVASRYGERGQNANAAVTRQNPDSLRQGLAVNPEIEPESELRTPATEGVRDDAQRLDVPERPVEAATAGRASKRFSLNRAFGRQTGSGGDANGADEISDPSAQPSRWRPGFRRGSGNPHAGATAQAQPAAQAQPDSAAQVPESSVSGILVADPDGQRGDQRRQPQLHPSVTAESGFSSAPAQVEDAQWTEHGGRDLSASVEHRLTNEAPPQQTGLMADRNDDTAKTPAPLVVDRPSDNVVDRDTAASKPDKSRRWRPRLPRLGANAQARKSQAQAAARKVSQAVPAPSAAADVSGARSDTATGTDAGNNDNRLTTEGYPAAVDVSTATTAATRSGQADVNREERTVFKRTNGRTDRVDRTRGSKADAVGRPLARQTSSASLWAERRSAGNGVAQRANQNRRNPGDHGTGPSRRRDGQRDLPTRAAGKDGFRSRYSQAQRRSRDKTQAVRDSSLPSRTRSQSRDGQETGVFASLLGRISSAVSGQRSRQPSGAHSSGGRAPGRRDPLSRDEIPAQREPRLTVSSLDQMPDDRMILPSSADGNYAPSLDTGAGAGAGAHDAGAQTAPNPVTGVADGSGYGGDQQRRDGGDRISDRDNRHNIDAVQLGAARGGHSASPAGHEETRRALQRELDVAEDMATESLKPQFDLGKIDTSRQIDQIAQIVELASPARRDDVLSIYRINEGRIAKPIRIIGLSAIDNSWVDLEQEPETGEYTEIVLTVQLFDNDGPVDESALHRFSDIVLQTADRIGGRPRFAMSFEDALDHAQSLEMFCKDYDRLAILSVVVGENSRISAEPLSEFAQSRGLVLNSMNIFHRPNTDPDGSPWRFGIANLFEPGTFNLDPTSGFETRGVRLFMSIPTVRDPEKVFDDMVLIAQDLCLRFSGTVVDQNKRPLTEEGIADIRSQMVAVTEEMRGYGFAPGDENTIRIFPQFGQD